MEVISLHRFYILALKRSTEWELENISKFADRVERFLAGELKELGAQVSERAEQLNTDEPSELFEFFSDDYFQLANEYPNILRASLFTHTYSFLEHRLSNLCENFRHLRKPALAPSDLKDDGVFRAKTYLKKVAGIKFPDNTQAWQDINTLRKLRNAVVHNDGRITKELRNSEEFKNFVKRFPSIELNRHDSLRFGRDFVPTTLKTVKEFLDSLLNVIPETREYHKRPKRRTKGGGSG